MSSFVLRSLSALGDILYFLPHLWLSLSLLFIYICLLQSPLVKTADNFLKDLCRYVFRDKIT